MTNSIRKHPPTLKARVAIEAIKGERTVAEIASIYNIHTSQIRRWKNIAIEGIEALFSGKIDKIDKENKELVELLYKQIGQLKVESDWLKKKVGLLEK
jgi:transposase